MQFKIALNILNKLYKIILKSGYIIYRSYFVFLYLFYLYKYNCGFCLTPFTLISKCKCDPVEFPVEPTAAIASPADTV